MSRAIREDTLKVKVLRYLSEIPISLSVLYIIWQLWWLSGWVVSNSCDSRDCSPPGSSVLGPWDFPGKNTEVGCHFLFQRSFPTQDWIWVSCIAGRSLLTEPPERKRLRAVGICVNHFNWFAACWAYDSFWRKGIFQEGQEGMFFTLEWCSRNDSKATATNGRKNVMIDQQCLLWVWDGE